MFNNKNIEKIYLDGTYLQKNRTWHVEDSPWKANQVYKIILKNMVYPTTICEVGCGVGEILSQLSQKFSNVNFYGYELSPQAYALCKTRESKNVQYKNINILNDDAFFDALLCIDVFEHVEDYIGFIKSLKSKAIYKIFHIPLEMNVLSIISGGILDSRKNVGHLHYFSSETAIATLVDCGYEIIDSFYTTSFIDIPSKSIKTKIAKIPRKILYAISPNLMVKLLGGCSLIVLTK